MSSRQSEEARDSNGEPTWHPAQEWLEESDEPDIDYHPAQEGEGSGDDDRWESEASDEEMGIEVSDGESLITGE